MKLIFKDLKFERVSNKNLKEILNLFKNIFKISLSLQYYKNYFYYNNKYYSFIVKDNNKIIGHVGFKIIDFTINEKKIKIAFRFSSMINKNYRKLGIYKYLNIYSFKKLKENNIYEVICWPNNSNLIGCKKHENFYLIDKIKTYSIKVSGVKNINTFLRNNKIYKCSLKNIKYINILNSSEINNKINIIKNYHYLRKKYFFSKHKNYYFYFDNFNLVFFSLDIDNNSTINVLDYCGKLSCLHNFIFFLNDYRFLIRFWMNMENIENINFLSNYNYLDENLNFNLGYYTLDKRRSKLLKNINKYDYCMGDSDVF